MINARIIAKIRELIRNEIRQINTCYPCQVVSVEGSRAKIRILSADVKDFDFPEILDVPIISLKAGNALINLPTQAGDKGLLFISTKPTLQFKTGQGRYYKADFDVDNSFYLGGIFTNGETSDGQSSENIIISKGDTKIEMSDDTTTIDSENVVVNSTDAQVNTETATVNATTSADINSPQTTIDSGGTGKVVVTGAGTVIDNKNFLTHVHSGVVSGPNNTGAVV